MSLAGVCGGFEVDMAMPLDEGTKQQQQSTHTSR